MPLFSRGHKQQQPTPTSFRTPPSDPAAALALLTKARRAYERAEEYRDREPQTRVKLETLYCQAAEALASAGHPAAVDAWLGLADVRRYQKGRRAETLEAFGRALSTDPGGEPAWDAYLDYFTYAPTAADLLAVVAGMPPHIRAPRIQLLVSVAERRDRWGTMPPAEGETFLAALPTQLQQLGDLPSLGLLLSHIGLRIEREGSHADAVAVLADAAATGHATPAAIDRLTVHLVKDEQWAKARIALEAALNQPIASDTMRERLTRRRDRCERQLR